MATVSINDVRKRYGPVEVIHGVSIDIADGEFVVLVGPSGCGKSTLLRMIAGLEGISGGSVSIGDRVVNKVPPKHRDIAMVFQSYALYPQKTVAQNMGFAMKIDGRPKAEIDEAVQEAAAILGLETFLDRYPRQLSGGQRQRVAMGRAIVRDPKAFLFDEPLSNLDAKLRVQMRAEIKALHQRLGTTMIYVTHDQIEAMTMADRIVVMNGGRVEQVGSPLELYDNPRNKFVASFLGSPSINLIPARTERRDGRTHAVFTDGAALPVPAGASAGEVLYGIRPEHLSVKKGHQRQGVHGTVMTVEPTGAETQVFVTYGVDTITASLRGRIDVAPDEPVTLVPDIDKALLFDPASGDRVRASEPIPA
jgi:multiple sugar transport system ATP-binding protein